MATTIYALCEPDLMVPVIRYIGKTGGPLKTRFRQHKKVSSSTRKTHLGCWLRSLRSRGETPVLMEITTVPDEIGSAAEILYIRLAREGGMDLVNATDGGEGVPMTPEIRKKIGDKNRGLKRTAEQNEANRVARLGEKNHFFGEHHTPEVCAEQSRRMTGKPGPVFSLETRKKLSAQKVGALNPMFGREITDEHRAKKRAASSGSRNPMFGRVRSEAERANIGEGKRRANELRRLPLFSDGEGI